MSRYDEVSGLSVGEMLRDSCRGVPGKEAIVSGSIRMTYKELDEQVTALAASLQKLGLGKGDMAAIYMKNSAELAIAFYACQRIGVIVAWANPNYREVETTFILAEFRGQGRFPLCRVLRVRLPGHDEEAETVCPGSEACDCRGRKGPSRDP